MYTLQIVAEKPLCAHTSSSMVCLEAKLVVVFTACHRGGGKGVGNESEVLVRPNNHMAVFLRVFLTTQRNPVGIIYRFVRFGLSLFARA